MKSNLSTPHMWGCPLIGNYSKESISHLSGDNPPHTDRFVNRKTVPHTSGGAPCSVELNCIPPFNGDAPRFTLAHEFGQAYPHISGDNPETEIYAHLSLPHLTCADNPGIFVVEEAHAITAPHTWGCSLTYSLRCPT